jgi:Trk-type K+ transport system membrane component
MSEIVDLKKDFRQTVYGQRRFHIAWTLYVLFLSFGGGLLIYACDPGLSFMDSIFISTSATVNGGLTVVPCAAVKNGTFVIVGWLMCLGSAAFMLLPTLIYRYYKLRSKWTIMTQRLLDPTISQEDHSVIVDHMRWCSATLVIALLIFIYIASFILFGAIVLTISLSSHPMETDLHGRGFTYFQNALFLSTSAFTNSGLALSDRGLTHMADNHFALFIITILILAGNTLLPVGLRAFTELTLYLMKYLIQKSDDRDSVLHDVIESRQLQGLLIDVRYSLEYALKYPRKICTYLFHSTDTIFLVQISAILTCIEYIVFVIGSVNRTPLLNAMGGKGNLLRLGIFQVINTRHAGFGMIDHRLMAQDTLFMTAIMMFLSPVPYIGLLERTAGVNGSVAVSPCIIILC